MGEDPSVKTSTSRRKLLSSAAAITTGSILWTGAAGASKSKEETQSKKGVVKAARKMMAKRKFDKAEKLLDKHNIEYSSSSARLQEVTDGVSTQARFRQDLSEISLYITPKYGDIYNVDAFMWLQGENFETKYASKAGDGFGVVFDHDEWSAVNPDKDDVQAEIV